MIPILYYGNETSFTSNGIGRLTEIISCKVTEERNGTYEVEFEYPSDGRFYTLLVSMVEAYAANIRASQGIIACIHDDTHDVQPFDIYSFSAPIDGVATFYAHHISYRLSGMIVKPIEAHSPADAMDYFQRYQVGADSFTFWTDKTGSGVLKTDVHKQIRSLLGGEEGSMLDIYGKGEYKFNKFEVRLYLNRGVDTGVTIRYGKNMVDVTREMDNSGKYNAVAPYWKGSVTDDETGESTDEIVLLTGNGYVKGTNATGSPNIVSMDFSSDFDEKPTVAQLQTRALQFLNDNTPWVPDNNITVDFVQLWQTTEYENVAVLQRVSLCDTVSVYYPELGIIASNQKIIKVVYDVLLERYDEMEIGEPGTSLSDSITQGLKEQYEEDLAAAKRDALTFSVLQAAIAHATELITGGLGGYVVFNLNADGEPQEILIMDHPDIRTAVKVIRLNQNGIGFSSTGYNGPFTTAWTIDGAFNANYITSGTISANLIKGGTLKLGGQSGTYGNGIMKIYDSSDNEIGSFDYTGIVITVTLYYRNTDWTYGTSSVSSSLRSIDHYKKRTVIQDGSLDLYAALAWSGTNQAAVSNPSYVKYASLFQAGPNATALISRQTGNTIHLAAGSGWLDIGSKDNVKYMYSNTMVDYGVEVNRLIIGRHSLYGYQSGITNRLQVATNINGNSGSWKFSDAGGGTPATFYTDKLYTDDIEMSTSYFYCMTIGCMNLTVSSGKNRLVETKDFSDRLMYSYETPSPMFGDIGESVLDEDGIAYIFIDPIFDATIDRDAKYQVFLQKYGEGDCWVSERKAGYFIVRGTPGLEFAWEMKAKQDNHDGKRFEVYNDIYNSRGKPKKYDEDAEEYMAMEHESVDYGISAAEYIIDLMEGRIEI